MSAVIVSILFEQFELGPGARLATKLHSVFIIVGKRLEELDFHGSVLGFYD